jgi:hypothetical protein
MPREWCLLVVSPRIALTGCQIRLTASFVGLRIGQDKAPSGLDLIHSIYPHPVDALCGEAAFKVSFRGPDPDL